MANQQSSDGPLVSVIIPCKGRLHHLWTALPTVLAQQCSLTFEVVVVDYGCPQDTFGWCRNLNARQLVALRVRDNVAEFHRSRSRNCGAAIARGAILAFVDADIRLQPTWLEQAAGPIASGRAGICWVSQHDMSRGWDRGGTCAIAAAVFHRVRGYDEAMLGWGTEDSDLHQRCATVAPHCCFAPGLLFPIKHSHEERVKFHAEKSLWTSMNANAQHVGARTQVNPQGYGQGDFEIHRGAGDVQLPVDWPASRHLYRPLRMPKGLARK